MTQLEAQMTAEIIAAHLMDDHIDPEKLCFLRERSAELVVFFDEQSAFAEQAA